MKTHTYLILFPLIVLIVGCVKKSSTISTETTKQKVSTMKNYFDQRGEVFVKLYKSVDDTLMYWEVWNTTDKTATTHFGMLGNLGEQNSISAVNHASFMDSVNSAIAAKIAEGYAEIPLEKQYTVKINFKLKTWGAPEDLDKREEYRNIITEKLGWTGNGRCDDGDIGSGEMGLYADVINPYLAIESITKEFKDKNIKEDYYFSISLGSKVIDDKVLPK